MCSSDLNIALVVLPGVGAPYRLLHRPLRQKGKILLADPELSEPLREPQAAVEAKKRLEPCLRVVALGPPRAPHTKSNGDVGEPAECLECSVKTADHRQQQGVAEAVSYW